MIMKSRSLAVLRKRAAGMLRHRAICLSVSELKRMAVIKHSQASSKTNVICDHNHI